MADEFDIIARYFAPLATDAGARGLVDDVALIEATGKLVVTTDAIVEGVHFLSDDPIDQVAKKALRVNLSDLAAKGAKPKGILLTLVWPDHRPASQITDFALGLSEDLNFYDVALYGGDTTSTPGPLTISITAWGEPLGPRTPSRAEAKLGDDVWVTGTIGDAVLGLAELRKDSTSSSHVVRRYRLPEPRVAYAATIASYARASMDVSDGLLQDAGKIARASGLALRLEADLIPLSQSSQDYLQAGGDRAIMFGGGDDYEILFTAAPQHREIIAQLGGVTRIGIVEAGEGAAILDAQGVPIAAGGWRHRLGA